MSLAMLLLFGLALSPQEPPAASARPLSSVLWNTFTGNERYRAITRTTMSLRMHWDLWAALPQAIFRRTTHHDRW